MSKTITQEDVDRFLQTVKATDPKLPAKWEAFVATLPDDPIPELPKFVPWSKSELIQAVGEKDYAALVVKAGSEEALLTIAGGGTIKPSVKNV